MLKRSMIALAIGSSGLISCATATDLPPEQLAVASLMHSNGMPAGSAQIIASGNQVSLSITVSGISKGPHGFHLHTTGACVAPDFTSAGGHLNPMGKDHGKLSPGGSHLGDLPNLEVGDSDVTSLTVDLNSDRAQLLSSLFDSDGTAIVIHADPDDHMTNPSGNAGPRIVCGVLRPS